MRKTAPSDDGRSPAEDRTRRIGKGRLLKAGRLEMAIPVGDTLPTVERGHEERRYPVGNRDKHQD